MTLQDIERDICRRLDKNATSLDPETKTRLDTFINDRYRELMRLDGIDLRDESYSLSTESGLDRYALPATHTQINGITDTTTRRRLQQRSISWMRQVDPGSTSIGTPQFYAVSNEAGILRQPSVVTANALEFACSATPLTADITTEFQDALGRWEVITVHLQDNVVPVPRAVHLLFRVYFQSLPATQGSERYAILRETVSQVALARLPVQISNDEASSTTTHQWVIVLWPKPSGAVSLKVDFAFPRRDLINATDEPLLPSDFHTVLVWGGCSEECLKMDDDRHGEYERKYQEDVKRLRAFLHHARGERWIPGRPSRGWSDLGGNYPADRW